MDTRRDQFFDKVKELHPTYKEMWAKELDELWYDLSENYLTAIWDFFNKQDDKFDKEFFVYFVKNSAKDCMLSYYNKEYDISFDLLFAFVSQLLYCVAVILSEDIDK
jgi:hypothetical protein